MSHFDTATKKMLATINRLAEIDPQDEAVNRTVEELQESVNLLKELSREDREWGKKSMEDDSDFMLEQIKQLKAAAMVPANNYRKIVEICDLLKKVALDSRRPENANVKKHLATAIRKISGIFAEVDTVKDLDKPLDQISKAVHSLYGDQSKNQTFYFDRRNKGHHGKDEK